MSAPGGSSSTQGRRSSFGSGPTPAPSNSRKRVVTSTDEGTQSTTASKSQRTTQHYSKHAPRIAESGIIKSIALVNFKCHKNFRQEFGPHVNLITGKNGSGKSAILAAFCACMGGNPNKHSGTASGAKAGQGLIREGADFAKVTVVLLNRAGDSDQFEGEVLGEEIIVEHELVRNGDKKTTGTYSINGTKASKAKVKLLAEHLNLQVENPCVMLTQAVASNFLRNNTASGAALRYQFFLSAANLDQPKALYLQTQDEMKQANEKLENHRARGPALREEAAKREQAVADARARVDAEARLKQIDGELAWRTMEKRQEDLDTRRAQLDGAQEEVDKMQAKMQEVEHAQEQLRKQSEAQLKAKDAIDKQLQETSVKLSAAKQEFVKATRAKKQVQAEHASAVAAHKAALSTQEEVAKGLADRVAEQEEQERRLQQLMDKEQDKKQKAAAKAKDSLDAADRELRDVQRSVHEQDAATKEEERRAAQARAAARHAQQDLANMQQAKDKDSLLKYGASFPDLLKAIAREKGWKAGAPVGPLGRHVRVKKSYQQYTLAVENALGRWGTLASLVVGCHEDEQRLRRLMSQFGHQLRGLDVQVQPREGRFQPSKAAWWRGLPAGTLSVNDVIEVDDDHAYNVLLNKTSPENTLLLSSYEEVKKIVFVHNGPARRAFTPDGSVHFRRGFGTEGTEKESRTGPAGLTVQDIREVVNQQEEERKRLAQAAEEAEQKATQQRKLADAKKAEAGRLQAFRDAADRVYRTATRELRDHANSRDADAHEHRQAAQVELDVANRDLQQAAKEEQQLATKLSKAEKAIEPIQRKHAELEEAHQALMKRREEAAAEAAEAASGDGKSLEVLLREGARHVASCKNKLETKKNQRETAKEELAAAEAEAAKLDAAVRAKYPQPASSSSSHGGSEKALEALQKEQQKLKRAVAKAEKSAPRGSEAGAMLERLEREQQQAAEAAETHAHYEKCCAATCDTLRIAIKSRYSFWRNELKRCSQQSDADFLRNLSQRGLSGSLKFDHEQERLDTNVVTSSQNVSAHATTDVKTLSGGEQAFTTLGLSLAMWQFSQAPVRAMDEFDKNMDSTFVKASLQLLIEIFEQQRSRQFLILTPLDYSTPLQELGIDADEAARRDFRFLRLTAPRDVSSQASQASQA